MPSPRGVADARAAALVCLGACVRLTAPTCANVRCTDIGLRCGGVIVTVRCAPAPWAVRAPARYHARLLQAAESPAGSCSRRHRPGTA